MADEQLEDWIAAKLARSVPTNNIVREICETRGLDWREAEKLVVDVSETHSRDITRRRTPVLLIIGGVTTLAGAFLLVSGILVLWNYAQNLLSSEGQINLSTLGLILAGNWTVPGRIFLGLMMVIGGAWGMGKVVGEGQVQDRIEAVRR